MLDRSLTPSLNTQAYRKLQSCLLSLKGSKPQYLHGQSCRTDKSPLCISSNSSDTGSQPSLRATLERMSKFTPETKRYPPGLTNLCTFSKHSSASCSSM